jgi:cytochrome b6-f complex iron-sulfur subunit
MVSGSDIFRGLQRRTVRAALAASTVPALARLVVGQYDSSPRTTRRDFLRWTVMGASAFFLAEGVAGFIAFFWPTKIGAFGTKIPVKKEEIPAVGATPVVNRDGKFWLVNNEDGLLALYWKCVHLGCTVPWVEGENQFHCPCHGSLYDRRGVVTGGPAPRPLDYMKIEVDGEQISVDTSTSGITVRASYDPSQAVKIS